MKSYVHSSHKDAPQVDAKGGGKEQEMRNVHKRKQGENWEKKMEK
jgi:hypothetical protein